MDEESIYGGTRLAQPDEVWNFKRGNGMEKAITLANILRNRNVDARIRFTREASGIKVEDGKSVYGFPYSGDLQPPRDEDLDF